jgi:hypothetical protein
MKLNVPWIRRGRLLPSNVWIIVFTISTLAMCMTVNRVDAQQGETQIQKQNVRGKVTDEAGKPLEGVSVVIKGSTKGVVTNEKGEYSIDIPEAGNKMLVFSFVGMALREVNVGTQKELSITLLPAEKSEPEVVVVGYGTQKKKSLTGAVQKISGEEIVNRPSSNVSSLLQGEAIGVTFATPASGYAPGNAPTIQIRSQAALNSATPPLIVIEPQRYRRIFDIEGCRSSCYLWCPCAFWRHHCYHKSREQES